MRSHFNRSALVRQLASWLPAPMELPRQDLAERLGGWLNVADAIELHAVHQALPALAVTRQLARRTVTPDVRADLERLRATLAQAIGAPPHPPTEASDTEFAPHHQRCLDQQRRMELGIDALRKHLRQTLTAASPRLAQLAALDAALDQLLGGREQRLLAGVPAFVKARFEHWRQAEPEAWPTHFEQDLQHALLAELDLRLQPLLGMVEALERH